ncbi:DnaJ domain-containing protein [Clostridium botulinum]
MIAGYKALAKKYHPDINNNSEAEDKFKAISVLKDMFLQQNLLN